MPLPKPKKGEVKKDWDDRCMGNPTMNREYPEQKQRYAVCSQRWRDRNKKHSDEGGGSEMSDAQGAVVPEVAETFAKAYAESGMPLRIPRSACEFVLPEEGVRLATEGEGHDFRMVVHTGKPVGHFFWGMVAIDLSGMKARAKKLPVLLGHVPSQIVGWGDRFSVEDDGWIAHGYYSKVTDEAAKVRELQKEGFPWQASMHATPLKLEQLEKGASSEVNGLTVKGPATIFRETVVNEVTFTPMAVDAGTSVAALAAGGEAIAMNRNLVTVTGTNTSSMGDETKMAAENKAEIVAALTVEDLAEHRSELLSKLQKDTLETERKRAWAFFEMFKEDAAFARDAYFGDKDLPAARVEFAERRAEAAEKRAQDLESAMPGEGQKPVQFQANADEERPAPGADSAVAKYEARIGVLMTAGKTRGEAILAIVTDEPALHEEWLKEINPHVKQ